MASTAKTSLSPMLSVRGGAKVMVVDDPDAAFTRAVGAGGKVVSSIEDKGHLRHHPLVPIADAKQLLRAKCRFVVLNCLITGTDSKVPRVCKYFRGSTQVSKFLR